MTENATVTLRRPDGTEETAELAPNDYILLLGPERYLHHTNRFANGTTIITIKRSPRSDG